MSDAPEILVVDDDASSRDLLQTILELDGHRVVAVAGGEEALDHLRDHPVSAVLLDRMMPGVDGLTVLRAIREDPSTALVPVLLVTALDNTDQRVAGLDIGADDYVTKPFEPEEVVARVRAHLRGHRAWVDKLTATVEQRRAVLTVAAERAGLADGADATALALCEELLALPAVDGATLVEVVGTHQRVLAGVGDDSIQRLRLAGRSDLIDDLAHGMPHGPRTAELPDHMVFLAPVAAAGQSLAVLAVTGDRTTRGARSDSLLALSIDFAALAGGVLGEPLRASRLRSAARERVQRIVAERAFVPVFQPIVRLVDHAVVGHEALTRFREPADSGPPDTEQIFVDAARLGAGLDLEEATLAAALEAARSQPPGAWLALNVTPSMIVARQALARLLDQAHRSAVVLEISELEPVLDYDDLLGAVNSFDVSVQLSVDDAGSGFASLAHILALEARFVKLDKSWISGIEDDPAKRALVAGLQNFAEETGAALIAEGIETQAQLETVRSLGIGYGQGWLLGEPHRF